MYRADLRDRLRAHLDPAPSPVPEPGDRLAAVLALLVELPELALVFTKRADDLRRHPGEISFPGGLMDPGDADLASTALREAREEIGLDPALPEILGALPPVHTTVSGILVVPFVGMLVDPPVLSVDGRETDRVLTFSVDRLLEAEAVHELERPDGRRWFGWLYEVEGTTVWGATGRMLHDLLEILRKEEP